MATYGYVRVSTANQAQDGESLDTQRRQVGGYAMQQGWELDRTFTERGVSGSKPLADRPQGKRMLAKLQPGDVVVAAKLDRVFRSALDALQTCQDFRDRGVALHLLDLGGDVTANGMAGLFMKVAAAFAEFERDRVAERVRDVKADQRARGRYLGGKVPFGYRVEGGALVPVPEQQAAVKTILRLGRGTRNRKPLSLRKITDEVRGRHGLEIGRMAVKRILDGHGNAGTNK